MLTSEQRMEFFNLESDIGDMADALGAIYYLTIQGTDLVKLQNATAPLIKLVEREVRELSQRTNTLCREMDYTPGQEEAESCGKPV